MKISMNRAIRKISVDKEKKLYSFGITIPREVVTAYELTEGDRVISIEIEKKAPSAKAESIKDENTHKPEN